MSLGKGSIIIAHLLVLYVCVIYVQLLYYGFAMTATLLFKYDLNALASRNVLWASARSI